MSSQTTIPPTFTGNLDELPGGTYDGDCPYCGTSLYMNIGRDQYGYCPEHKVSWWIGSNVFSSWLYEGEETWERNARKLANYRRVEPWYRCEPAPPPERCSECGQMLPLPEPQMEPRPEPEDIPGDIPF